MNHHPGTQTPAARPPASIVLTYWVPVQYRVTLSAADVESRLRAAGQAEAADLAGKIARREIAGGDLGAHEDDLLDTGLGILVKTLARYARMFGADEPSGEPTDCDSPRKYHLWVGPPPRPAAVPGTAGRTEHDVLAALFAVATESQEAALRELATAVGLQWLCPCGWYNPGPDAQCDACQAPRPRPGEAK